MDRIKKGDSPLLKQYKRWAKDLLNVNPRYVIDPNSIVWYIKGPNWSDPGVEYAHYRFQISLYGDDLLKEFERIRVLQDKEAVAEYSKLKDMACITDKDGE